MKNTILENNAQFLKKPFDDFLNYLKESGVMDIDLSLIVPHTYIDTEEYINVNKITDKLSTHGIRTHVVTPHPYRYSITAESGTEQYRGTIGYYKRCIDFAELIGAGYMTITGSGGNFDKSIEELTKSAIHSLNVLAEYAGMHSVRLLLGTVLGEFSPNNETTPLGVNLIQTREIIKAVNSENLKVYMDTEVIGIMGETLTEWFESFGQDIKLIRLTDGNYNGYCIWGKGVFPLDRYLDTIKDFGYDGLISLQIPGDIYADSPEAAMKENRFFLMQHMEGKM